MLGSIEYKTKQNTMSKTTSSKIRKQIYSRFSILQWLPHYTKAHVVADLVAGITIGLTMMPQSMAYAALANLTPQYGLYSSFMGSFIYVIFGTIKEVSIGPTSLMALLTVEYTRDLPVEFVILLAFLAGCMELLLGVLKLGFLVDFISVPVISGFQSATSVIIIGSQLKGLLGLRFKSKGFVDNIRQLGIRFPEIKQGDAILGLSCILILIAFRKLKDVNVTLNNKKHEHVLKRTLWFLSISRNAIVVLVCSIVAYFFEKSGPAPFILSRNVDPGLPSFTVPKFESQVGNHTYTFFDMVQELGSGIIVTPLVAVLANVAIAKAFAAGKTVDATQEMITLGLCNIFGAFVKSMPTCGAFTRSAVSNASGVRSPLAGLYSGSLILLALTFLTPYFHFIPRATLSAVLISAVMFMIDFEILVPVWKSNKLDFFTTVSVFIVSLLCGVQMGLLFGVIINVANLLRLWARPTIHSETFKTEFGQEYLVITPAIGLFFPAVDFLRGKINKAAMRTGNQCLPVVLDCKTLFATDYTAAKGIESVNADFEKRHQLLILLNVLPNVKRTLNEVSVKKIILCDNDSEIHEIIYDQKILTRDSTLPEKDLEKDMQKPTLKEDLICTNDKLSSILLQSDLRNLQYENSDNDQNEQLSLIINISEDDETANLQNDKNKSTSPL